LSIFSDYFSDDPEYGWLWDLGDTFLGDGSKTSINLETVYTTNILGGIHFEGEDFSATISGNQNIFGKEVFWSLSGVGVSSEDILSGKLFGSGTFNERNSFTLNETLTKDSLTEGNETLILKFYNDSLRTDQIGTEILFLALDVSKGLKDYSISISPESALVNEGSALKIDISLNETPPAGIYPDSLSWSISGLGINSNDLADGTYLSDYSYLYPDNKVSIHVGLSADSETEGNELATVTIEDDYSNIVDTIDFIILDKYKTPECELSILESTIREGSSIVINGTTNLPEDSILLWIVEGENFDRSDISFEKKRWDNTNELSSPISINEEGTFSIQIPVNDDEFVEGTEKISLKTMFRYQYFSDEYQDIGTPLELLIKDKPILENVNKHEISTEYKLTFIRDYDGNLHANTGSVSDETKSAYKYQGLIDINADGLEEAIYTNNESGRWVTASISKYTGEIDYSDTLNGLTRIVGIYVDPMVQLGLTERDGPSDSQRRFQNDLNIDNLTVKASGDYDGDGYQEVYWKTNDGTAYLRALMHADGNIQYANYQSEKQMSEYLTSKGFETVISEII